MPVASLPKAVTIQRRFGRRLGGRRPSGGIDQVHLWCCQPQKVLEKQSFIKAIRGVTMSVTANKTKKKSSSLVPLGDRVVIEREESEQKTAGGILLPDSAKDKPARGTVVSIGDGRISDMGIRHALQVKPGDRVVFLSYAGEQFKVGDTVLLLMREDDILAVLG